MRVPPFGYVTGNLGEADVSAAIIMERIDYYAGPEAGSILADAPAFAFKFALCGCRRECPCRQPLRPIFVGVEPGEVLAENFVALISFDAFRTGVPAPDLPSGSSR